MSRNPNGYMDAHIAEAEVKGISRKTFYRRLELGWTVQKAKTKPVGARCPFMAKARATGVGVSAYQARLRRGWSKAKAATAPKQQQFKDWNIA